MFQKISYSRKFGFIRCSKCSFVTINPYPTKKQLTDFYLKEYDYSYMNLNNKRVKKINENRLVFLSKYLKKGNLLDIGCGTGLFLNQAKKHFDVEGLEYSKYACDIAKNMFKLKVYNTDIESFDSDKKYDVVTSFHVLEHIRQPDLYLHDVKKIIKKKGHIYIIVPNINSFSFLFFGKYWEWLNPPKHLSYFNMKTLKLLLRKEGYDIVDIKTQKGDDYNFLFNFLFFIINILGLRQFFFKKMFEKNKKSGGISVYNLVFSITNFICMFFFPIRKVLENKGYGSEISVIARKH
jgi:2-polyprenyl-3-methyl-5-hydroxy-6-metoxy-1,4-benzoquinol methylase